MLIPIPLQAVVAVLTSRALWSVSFPSLPSSASLPAALHLFPLSPLLASDGSLAVAAGTWWIVATLSLHSAFPG